MTRQTLFALPLLALGAAGCGNQMYKQPSYTPLDTPRAVTPAQAVPINAAVAPTDSRPVASPAWGDLELKTAIRDHGKLSGLLGAYPSREPSLPPPNLSDQARYQPAPAAVNALQNPLPNDPRIVHAGKTLFLNRCVQCHNAGGYGYGTVGQYLIPHPPNLAEPLVQNRTNGAIFWHITQGQGKMPGFRRWTTPSERWALTAYVRSLKGAPKPADPATLQTSTALEETKATAYPVYGVTGFENGESAAPMKTISVPTADQTHQGRIKNLGFGQTPQSR